MDNTEDNFLNRLLRLWITFLLSGEAWILSTCYPILLTRYSEGYPHSFLQPKSLEIQEKTDLSTEIALPTTNYYQYLEIKKEYSEWEKAVCPNDS